jgi:hypothetical protein
MDLARMLRPWRASLQPLLRELHGYQTIAVSDAVMAMVEAGHCQLSRMAVALRGRARVTSGERRMQRLVANERLDVEKVMSNFARSVLSDPGEVTLILDETPQANHLRTMKLCREMCHRALPVLWHCYLPKAPPMRMDRLILDLLQRAADLLPRGQVPTLLADRGLAWPVVVDFCRAAGWHFVLRIQHHTRVLFDDGRMVQVRDLVPKRGTSWRGCAQVFKKASWRRVNIVATWSRMHDEPWLLITDLPPERSVLDRYAKRMRVEVGFRDEKSHGLHWEQSRIRDPAHAHRLLLLIALAMRILIWIGRRVVETGQYLAFERRNRCTLSVVQLALRYLCHPDYRTPLRP